MKPSAISTIALLICIGLNSVGCKPASSSAPGTATTVPAKPSAPGTAVANSDEAIAKRLVGAWLEERSLPNGGHAESVSTYSGDGTYKEEATITAGGKTQVIRASGKWEVKDGQFNETITDFPQAPAKVGTKSTLKIISLSDTEFAHENLKGEKHTAKRRGK